MTTSNKTTFNKTTFNKTTFNKEEQQAIVALLPDNPEDFLTDQDRSDFAEWSENNRKRRYKVTMDTGVDRVG
jgi:hypothetical protein